MNWIRALGTAFAMYSRIPMPKLSFRRQERERALCFFPIVGWVQGLLELILLSLLTTTVKLPLPLLAVVWLFFHHWLTGFIHLDGFMDVQDAKASQQTKERQLEIMKDPHLGAFAVLHTVFYLLFEAVLFFELLNLPLRRLYLLPFLYAYLRVFSGGAVYLLPKAKKDGLAVLFGASSKRTYLLILALQAILNLAFIFYLVRCPGILFFAAALFLFAYLYLDRIKKEYGGITGDLAGHLLMLLELLSFAYLYFFFR